MNTAIIITSIIAVLSTAIAAVLGRSVLNNRFRPDTLIADFTTILDHEGFNWGKDEGELFVEKHGHRFDIRLEQLGGRDGARIRFIFVGADEALGNISEMGRLVIADQLNERHPSSVTAIRTGAFRIIISADIRSAKEAYIEFLRSYDRTGRIANDLNQLKNMAIREFPARKEPLPHIGFAA